MAQEDYVFLEKICSGYFGKEILLRERGVGGKIRHGKVVRFQCTAKAKLAAESLRQDIQQRQLDHKNVRKFKAAFDMIDNGEIYLCTVWSHYEEERMESMNDFIVNRRGSLDSQESRTLMVQMVDGLSFLHVNNVSHNALCPFSVLILKGKSGEAIAKIADYGLRQVCGRPLGENYRPDGGRTRSMLYHLPPEAFGRSWDRCCRNYTNTTADVFMLGLLFVALAEQTILPPGKNDNEALNQNLTNSTEQLDTPIVAAYLQYPGYAPIPLGKFLHENSSVDVDQQLYRQSSPALRSLVRRMLLLVPGKRPPASGVAQILSTIRTVRRTGRSGSQTSLLSDTSTSSVKLGKKRERSSSLLYDPSETPSKRRTLADRLPSLSETTEEAKGLGSALVRRASIRVTTTKNILMRKNKTKNN